MDGGSLSGSKKGPRLFLRILTVLSSVIATGPQTIAGAGFSFSIPVLSPVEFFRSGERLSGF